MAKNVKPTANFWYATVFRRAGILDFLFCLMASFESDAARADEAFVGGGEVNSVPRTRASYVAKSLAGPAMMDGKKKLEREV